MTGQENKNVNETCVRIENSPVSHLLMATYVVAFVLGLVFNMLTAWPIIQQIRSKNVLGVYLLSLSVSDVLYAFTMPLWIHYFYNQHQWTLGQNMCKLAGFVFYSNMYISIYLLCCISVDRCLAVTFPLKTKTFRRYRYAWGICGLIYIFIIALHILVIVMDQLSAPLNEEKHCYETYPMTDNMALFNLLRVVIGFLLPLIVLAVCYWLILSKVKQSVGLDEQGKRKVRLLSVGVLSIFSICFAPYHIQLLVRSIAFFTVKHSEYCRLEQAQHFYFSGTLALSSLNSAVDPVLYVLASNGVRENFRLCCKRRAQSYS